MHGVLIAFEGLDQSGKQTQAERLRDRLVAAGRVVAGCAHDNHLSKKALERAGMYAPTRLLKVGY